MILLNKVSYYFCIKLWAGQLVRYAIYFNGLGDGRINKFQKRALMSQKRHGIEIKHIPINWHSGLSFDELLYDTVRKVKQELKEHNNLILIGASAGGSLALNVYSGLINENIKVITICARINENNLPSWDLRTLSRMAHIGTRRQSKSFYGSVMYCTNIVIPSLTIKSKCNIVNFYGLADEVVPIDTMKIDGIKSYGIKTIGHFWGINTGIKQTNMALSYFNEIK